MRELFRQVSDPRPGVRDHGLSALPLSIIVHVLVLMAVVVIPLLASDVLPAIQLSDINWTPVTLPSPPPSPPVAVARSVATAVATTDAAPTEAPSGINPETGISPAAPDVAAPLGGDTVPGADLPPGWNSSVISEPPPPTRPTTPVPARSLLRPPARIVSVAPNYPELARQARIEGAVIIEAVIGTSGDVTDARVLRSVAMLDQSALDAVRQWKYTPTMLNGVAVPVVMTVTVTFTLK
jgi:periplasmic protein TonB